MDKNINTISVKKKVSVWNKPLKVNYKDLFIALTKVAIGVSSGKFEWDSYSKDLVDSLTSFEFEEDISQLAYLLIHKSLLKTLFDIAKENSHLIKPIDIKAKNELLHELDMSFENEELEIDESFFLKPTALPILDSIKKPFGQWIERLGVSKARSGTLMERIKPYFLFNLDLEWCHNHNDYQAISQAIKSPFTESATHERNWLTYYSFLNKNIHQPVLGIETFDITNVYVPLRAFYIERKELDKQYIEDSKTQNKISSNEILHVVDLKEYLVKWLNNNEQDNSLKIITGGPGSGKSTFTKLFAEFVSSQNILRVMYIPLYKLNIYGDLFESVGKYAKNAHFFNKNPLDVSRNEKILIVFDGVDELPFRGRYSVENTTHFIREAKSLLNNLNEQNPKIKFIITGRSVVIQHSATELRKTGIVLNILPYYIMPTEQTNYTSPSGLEKQDQRDIWWKLYGQVTGTNYSSLPEQLKSIGKWLDDITSQPLLNYLVALSLERGKIIFDANTNVSMIYQDLFNAVHERSYEKRTDEKGTLRLISDISKDNFIRYLQEIAIAAWHNDGRTATVKQIQTKCRLDGLKNLPDYFGEESKSGILRILTAFYFSKFASTNEGDDIFEFTHKSFQEFLTSRRIIEEVNVVSAELNRRKNNPYSGIGEETALIRWAELCGPSKIDHDTARFIVDHINLAKKPDLKRWLITLLDLTRFIRKYDFPMEKLTSKFRFKEQKRISENAEIALYFILQAISSRIVTLPIDQYEINELISRSKMIGSLSNFVKFDDLEAILLKNIQLNKETIEIEYIHVTCGTTVMPIASVKLKVNGKSVKGANSGKGPIDSVFITIAQLIKTESELIRFRVSSDRTEGGVTILLKENEKLSIGYGSDPDIIVASAKAYVNAINRLIEQKREVN